MSSVFSGGNIPANSSITKTAGGSSVYLFITISTQAHTTGIYFITNYSASSTPIVTTIKDTTNISIAVGTNSFTITTVNYSIGYSLTKLQ